MINKLDEALTDLTEMTLDAIKEAKEKKHFSKDKHDTENNPAPGTDTAKDIDYHRQPLKPCLLSELSMRTV